MHPFLFVTLTGSPCSNSKPQFSFEVTSTSFHFAIELLQ